MSDRPITVRATLQGEELAKWLHRQALDMRDIKPLSNCVIVGGNKNVIRDMGSPYIYLDPDAHVDLIIRPPKPIDDPYISTYDIMRMALRELEEAGLPPHCKMRLEIDR
jgi:hypothetical protein